MKKEEISAALCAFIKKSIVESHVAVDTETPFESIGIDSLSIIELVLFLERKFAITLPEEALLPEHFKSVDTLSDCALRYVQK